MMNANVCEDSEEIDATDSAVIINAGDVKENKSCRGGPQNIPVEDQAGSLSDDGNASSASGETGSESGTESEVTAENPISPDGELGLQVSEKSTASNKRKNRNIGQGDGTEQAMKGRNLGEDDRSQTPLQDEDEARSESLGAGADPADNSAVFKKMQKKTTSSKSMENNGNGNAEDETASNDDDHGEELDYDEELNQDSAAVEPMEKDEDEPVKKPSKKTRKKKEEKPKEKDKEEKEEGEESDEGEAEDTEPEDGSTDGELDDDEDCEEGEIKDPGAKKPFVRPICRFFMRGSCTWGINCRFLHPGVNDKGSYAMMDPPMFPHPMPPGMMVPPMMGPGGRPLPPPGPWMHDAARRMPRPMDMGHPMMEPELPPPQQAEPVTESAWERGLRHAKEIRKKRSGKENDASDDKKNEKDEKDRRSASPPPRDAPPPVREPVYNEQMPPPPMMYEDQEFYGRPMMPPMPPEMWPYRPPFDPRWVPHGLPPPPFMPPPPDFRIPEHERTRRFSPPPGHPARFDPRRDGRFNPWFDRGGPPDGPPREPPGGGENAPPGRGRSEDWKDPWLRSKSPKRTRRSSSHSASRGRRRYRTRSKGSYSSPSSSSYSSSRSRSSSSYTSSYTRSSRSSSSSSRSSSRSRSRSPVKRKPLPTSTLGQSILERKKLSEIPRGITAQTEGLVIGSGPLPARAPPEKKPPPSVEPPPASAAAPTRDVPKPIPPPPDAVKSPPTSAPTGVPPLQKSSSSLKLGQPLPLTGRAPLQPVGRGVAAAFLNQEDDVDVPEHKPPGKPLRLPSSSPEKDPIKLAFEKAGLLLPADKIGVAKIPGKDGGNIPVPGPVPPPVSKAGGDVATTFASIPKGGLAHLERGDGMAVGFMSQQVKDGKPAKTSTGTFSSSHATTWKDPWDRSRLEKGRNVLNRPVSSSSRSGSRSSAGSRRSLSSLSSSSSGSSRKDSPRKDSGQLYRNIASPISSTSSPSPSPIHSPVEIRSKPGDGRPKLPSTPPPPRAVVKQLPSPVEPPPRPEVHKVEKIHEHPPSSRPSAREVPREERREREPRKEPSHRVPPPRELPPREPHPREAQRPWPREPPREVHREVPKEPSRDAHREHRERDRDPRMISSSSRGSAGHYRDGSNRFPSSGGHLQPLQAGHMDDGRSRTISGSRGLVPQRSSEGRPRTPGSHHGSHRSSGGGGGGADLRLTTPSKSDGRSSKVDVAAISQASQPTASRKRAASYELDVLVANKVMRHEIKEPVKVSLPKPEKPPRPSASMMSPPHGARSGMSRTAPTQPSAAAPAVRSPGKAAPLAKPPAAPAAPAPVGSIKRKSMSSRREELLSQLKAVEDAIAKKRSKMQ